MTGCLFVRFHHLEFLSKLHSMLSLSWNIHSFFACTSYFNHSLYMYLCIFQFIFNPYRLNSIWRLNHNQADYNCNNTILNYLIIEDYNFTHFRIKRYFLIIQGIFPFLDFIRQWVTNAIQFSNKYFILV